MPAPNTPFYNDDQWMDLMKMQDLTGQEQQIARQQAMAKDLREGGGNRIDMASQIAQGLRGVGGAMMDYKALQGMQDLSKNRKDVIGAMGQRRPSLPIAPPSGQSYDPSQFNDFTGQYGGG